MRGVLAGVVLLGLIMPATAASARDSLGVFGEWGAFRDPETPRCYAIAKAAPSRLQRDHDPFASIGTWPTRKVRGQIHFRVSRTLNPERPITLRVGEKDFILNGSGPNAWAKNSAADSAIMAAIRAAGSMTISASDARGRRFSNTYDLNGAATAMDAATVGCARLG